MFGKKSNTKTVSKKPEKKITYISYRMRPTNYTILSEEEKTDVLKRFMGIMKGSEENGFRMSIMNSPANITVSGDDTPKSFVERAVYVTSKYDMGSELMSGGFMQSRLEKPVQFEVEEEKRKALKLKNYGWFRAYAVYDFSRSIQPAWIGKLAQICAIVNIDVKNIRAEKASSMLLSHANTLATKLGKRHQIEAAEAREINDMLIQNETSIYEVCITVLVSAEDEKSLKEQCKEFEKQARRRQIKVMAIAGKQTDTLEGWGKKFLFSEFSCTAFYPFTSSDMLESSSTGGVYLGTNELTGVPVIYNYLLRKNYNMTILGASGAGKINDCKKHTLTISLP